MAGPRGEGSLGILHLGRPTMESKDTSPPVSPCGSGVRIFPLRQSPPCLWRFFVRITEKQPAMSASSRSLPAIGCRVPTARASPPSDALRRTEKVGVVDRDGARTALLHLVNHQSKTFASYRKRIARAISHRPRDLDQVPWIGAAQRPKIVSAILPRSARCRGADARISSPSIPTRFSPSPNSLTSAATIRCVISA